MDYPRRPLWSYSYTAAPWIDHVPRALQQEPVSHNPESSTTMAGSDTLDAEENAGWNSPLGNPVSHYVPYDYAPPPAVQNNGENHVFLNFASAGTNGHEPARFPSASMFHPSTYLQSSVGAASEQQAGWTSGATSHGNYWSPNALDQLMGPTGDAGFGYDRASSLPVQGLFDVPSDHPTPPHLGIRNVLTNTSFVGSPGVVYGAVNGTPFPVSPLAAAPVGPPVAGPSTSLARRPESDRAATGSRPGGDYSTFDPSMSAPTVSTAPFSSFSIPNDLSSTITTPPISGTLLPLAVHPVQCSTMASMERNAVPYDHGTVQEIFQQDYGKSKQGRRWIIYGPNLVALSAALGGVCDGSDQPAFPGVKMGQKMSFRFSFTHGEYSRQVNVLLRGSQPTYGRLAQLVAKEMQRFIGQNERFKSEYEWDKLILLRIDLVPKGTLQARIGYLRQ